MPLQPLFTADWPRYIVAAHVLFWSVSAVFLVSCLGGVAGLIGGQIILWLFWSAVASAFLLGLAATCSGKLYVGNQVFRRTPMTGWAARAMGIVVCSMAAFLMLLAYGLTHMRGALSA